MKTKLKETVGKTHRKYVSKFYHDIETDSYEYEDIHMKGVTKDALVFIFRTEKGKLLQYYLNRRIFEHPEAATDDEETSSLEFLGIIESTYHLPDESKRLNELAERMEGLIMNDAFSDIITEDMSMAFGFGKKDKNGITRIFTIIRDANRNRPFSSSQRLTCVHGYEFVDVMFADIKVDAYVKYTSLLENPKIGYKSLREIRKEKDIQRRKRMDAINEACSTSENEPAK